MASEIHLIVFLRFGCEIVESSRKIVEQLFDFFSVHSAWTSVSST